jgi:aldehyde:ferredoxin oxidoreductase
VDQAPAGQLGLQLKRAGYDAVVVEGKSEKAIYLLITVEKAEIKCAEELWGLDVVEAHKVLSSIEDKIKPTIAAIGPSGERVVHYACIVNDNRSFFGRCGLGAVMGAKDLKAITVSGCMEPLISHPEKVKELSTQIRKMITNSEGVKHLRLHGQAAAGKVPDWKYILQDYWQLRGWDDNGRPTHAKLEELGIA